MFVLVCRATEGGRPGSYYMVAGQRVRVHLLQAFERAGLVDEALRATLRGATRRSGAAAMGDRIAVLASALAQRLDTLLARFDRVFPSGG